MATPTVAFTLTSNLFPQLLIRYPQRAAAEVGTAADHVVATAQTLVRVDTGELRDSIAAHHTPGAHTATVETDKEYAAPQEYGFHHWISHQFVPGQPYLTPAAAQEAAPLNARIAAALRRG